MGSTLAGASVYYYILEEYKVSNELLTEDIYVRDLPNSVPFRHSAQYYPGGRGPSALAVHFAAIMCGATPLTSKQALQAAVQRIHSYVTELENRIVQSQRK